MAKTEMYYPASYVSGDFVIVTPEQGAHFSPFQAASHKAAQKKLFGMLKVDGPRGLLAMTKSGAVVGASLYEGGDFIYPAPKRKAAR